MEPNDAQEGRTREKVDRRRFRMRTGYFLCYSALLRICQRTDRHIDLPPID